jgi:5,10-methylenetetrahydromethanopterin reductase
MKLGCSFATSLETPEHIRIAEGLGYERALCYDSPALYPDVWMMLNQAAELTDRIVLGPGVLIPSLRHPMVTASAITTLVHTAGPDRVLVGVGSGFTGRLAMGRPPVPWATVEHYIRVVQALLRGEQVQWEGAVMQLIHPDERFGPRLPISVPWGVAGEGPKGTEVAKNLDAELFRFTAPEPHFNPQTMLVVGTVLDDDEDPAPSTRSMRRATPPGSSCTGRWSTVWSTSCSARVAMSGPRRTTTSRRTSGTSRCTSAIWWGSTTPTAPSSTGR